MTQPFVPDAALRVLGLTFRPETDDDIGFLRDLYVSMRWDELAPLTEWSEAAKMDFLTQQFTLQRRHYRSAYHDAAFLVIADGAGDRIGRIYLYHGGSDIRVVDVGLLPDRRGRGIGAALFQALFTMAQASNRSVSVHVEKFNPAQRLYERLGFRDVSEDGPYRLMEWRPTISADPLVQL